MPVFGATRRGLCASTAIAAVLGAAVASSAPAEPAARTARTVPAIEHVALTLAKKTGTKFQHKGRATGTVAGSVSSRITLTSLSIAGTVTVRAKGGTLQLKVRGTARSGGLRSKFDGTATMTGGTGRYAGARGKGTFTGVVNRRTWAATIDARGSLTTP
ncbi:MAG TPA: autotransporter [Baekduia sp.]|nr:autotransporter [Baekduia sp.]